MPACPTRACLCEAHHVTWWRHGGTTDIDNMALVCGRHHSAVHTGLWTLTMREGVCWATPPRWLDPLQRPLRNTTHTSTAQARAVGVQLRLALDPPPQEPPPQVAPEPPPG